MSELTGHAETRMGSERSFGIVFAVVFLIVALFPLTGGGAIRWWALIAAGAFLAAGLLVPIALRPLNIAWFQFGLLLNRIVSPIVMALLFFAAVTPVGLIRRLGNPDPLRQRLDRSAASYWIEVDRARAARSSMRRQF